MTVLNPDLEIDHITVRFGGLVAVDDVSLSAPAGRITGLMGPNGAGKTTTFNACTGLVDLADGTVRLGDEPLRGLPSRRAQAGLGRTFQRIELFDSMSVAENVAMGAEALQAGRGTFTQLVASRTALGDVRRRADDAIELCDIGPIADRNAGELSTGQRRLVELARAIATRFRFLLLDEPSSGLDVGETEQFGRVLETLVAEQGIGLLLVEHDMALVRAVCEYAYVLDFGRLVYHGTTSDVLGSDIVRAAYLGSEAVEAADNRRTAGDAAAPPTEVDA
jgi:ABC-type branched-subunit amino acid transport system ATPase component